ncbi:hypothetical protein J1N35_007359, partial [Gossypium stocksii]
MASSFAPVSVLGSHLKVHDVWFTKSNNFRKTPSLAVRRKLIPSNRQFSVCAEYWYVLLDFSPCAIFGTIAYVFAPQIRRSLLNEDEYGCRKAKRLIYYDEGLE